MRYVTGNTSSKCTKCLCTVNTLHKQIQKRYKTKSASNTRERLLKHVLLLTSSLSSCVQACKSAGNSGGIDEACSLLTITKITSQNLLLLSTTYCFDFPFLYWQFIFASNQTLITLPYMHLNLDMFWKYSTSVSKIPGNINYTGDYIIVTSHASISNTVWLLSSQRQKKVLFHKIFYLA